MDGPLILVILGATILVTLGCLALLAAIGSTRIRRRGDRSER